jgi:XTP/dITP diphosphohydrolase
MNSLYYVTTNKQKVETVQNYIHNNNLNIRIEQLNLDLSEKQAEAQEEVALDKAEKAFEIAKNNPILVDDEGMFFDAYENFPGVYTKFIMQSLRYIGMVRLLPSSVSHSATFKVSLVYKDADVTKLFQGAVRGKISIDESMYNDLHPSFAKCFIPEGADTTYEALRSSKEFENYNFRALAFKEFLTWYSNYKK